MSFLAQAILDTLREKYPDANIELLGGARIGAGDARPIRDEVDTVAALKAAAARYSAPNPFRVGDLVTPRANADVAGSGEPHVVLETAGPYTIWDIGDNPKNANRSSFGQRFDTRVARWSSGDLIAYWVESWTFEPWEPPAEGRTKKPEGGVAPGQAGPETEHPAPAPDEFPDAVPATARSGAAWVGATEA